MSEHIHDHNCDCGEDHGEEVTVTLTLDDGSELDCAVLSIFPVDDNQYIALVPMEQLEDENEENEGDIFLYRFIEHDNNELELLNIEDDDEYEKVADAFDELLDDDEFDELLEDE